MTSYILDASVAAAWMLPPLHEPLSQPATQICREYINEKIQLQAPDLIFPEIGNVLRKSTLHGRITSKSAQEEIDAFLDLNIPIAPTRPLLKLAFSISAAHRASVYDCIYVALAAIAQRPLITADERLANMMGGYYPVYWLGAI